MDPLILKLCVRETKVTQDNAKMQSNFSNSTTVATSPEVEWLKESAPKERLQSSTYKKHFLPYRCDIWHFIILQLTSGFLSRGYAFKLNCFKVEINLLNWNLFCTGKKPRSEQREIPLCPILSGSCPNELLGRKSARSFLVSSADTILQLALWIQLISPNVPLSGWILFLIKASLFWAGYTVDRGPVGRDYLYTVYMN